MNHPFLILGNIINKYTTIDFSDANSELSNVQLNNPYQCQEYIETILNKTGCQIAYGGYLEKRNLYNESSLFSLSDDKRDIHLGIDFWSNVNSEVLCPLKGEVHSFKDNSIVGDYGPTIILKHGVGDSCFYTLYGHLSRKSLSGLFEGKKFEKGEVLGYLGSPEENVNYAPHLHFQVINDLQGKRGDYPGVCSSKNLEFYKKNCPDPNSILKM
ncbi:peptidase M23 [Euzebyella marina]|uniref:Peptidase M23 n=1 Tax=Euzebyella marina TaxID=1761453 RepID=A0A3G2L8U0_9FLAO|nr:peptidoglycan DD-metalloendopeptidase family protein [Euzebyella marina]AYN68682.1 peptidase M23 [Euzebyella marina]